MQNDKRKNKARGLPAGATISGHAPHELFEQIAQLVKSSGESRSYIVIEAVRAGLPAVASKFAKGKSSGAN